jgi:DNA-binding NarL/FixJ family response regulator
MLALAAGDPGAAIDPLQRAGATFERLGHRPDAARAVLAQGRALLMAGHRVHAARALTEARGRFAEISAPLWEARAAEQLERAAPGSAGGRLSEAERQVAALAIRGLKNREIAEALFMAVATVEAHLTRLYRKLGIRTRSELARLVAEGQLENPDDPGMPRAPQSPA